MAVLILVPFFIAIKKGSFSFKNIASLVLHLIICVLVTLVLAGMTLEIVITETNVYVVADVSYSSHEMLEQEDSYIADLSKNLPKNSKMGLVCFGKDAELVTEVGDKMKSVSSAKVDTSETNISGALEYTATLFNQSVIKRIVLITDGKETRKSGIVSVIAALEKQDIYVDAIFLDNNIPEGRQEVQINSIDFSRSTFKDKQEDVYALIQSTVDTEATLKLSKGEISSQKKINLIKGLNTVSMALDTSSAGTFDYQLEIETPNDTSPYNNVVLLRQEVTEKVKMMFLSGKADDKAYAEKLYGDQADVDYYVNVLDVPYSLEDLALYDEYVLSNIDIRTLHNASQLMTNLDIMVSEFGKSLITLGNTYIQNSSDSNLNQLGDMLPVQYGANDEDSKLLAIVIDVSRSMEMNYKLIMAKQAACAMLDLLKDSDWVMVIAFWGDNQMVQSAVPASQREKVKDVINDLEAAQGTMMTSALNLASKELQSQISFSKKEVFLISDGVPYGGAENNETAARDLKSKGVTISTLNTNGTGVDLMNSIASIGGGYSYLVKNVEDLDNLMYTEIADDVTDSVIEGERFDIVVQKLKNELVLDLDVFPQIRGFYFNKPKTNVQTILTTTYTTETRVYEVPVYCYWSYGTGKVSSFACDISGYWLSEWKKDESNGEELLKRVVSANMPKERIDSPFLFDIAIDNVTGSVSIYVPNVNSRANVELRLTHPNGTTLNQSLVFDSTNYVAAIELGEVGTYKLEFTYSIGNLTYSSDTYFEYSYKPEYDSFENYNESSLYYMVTSNGKVGKDGSLKIENNNSYIETYIYDFTILLMSVCVGLFVVDIFIRKVKWQDIKSLFKKQNKKKGENVK